ncbi:hypothetical protein F5146DRAFT_195817 [Armillaria mellea]|nr:hypothetical protein F5146DRAFT_195817 [Armillaria mellea]
METTQLRNITTTDAPFDDPTDSVDLVIRSADDVEFFVLSGLLSLQSPLSFFRHVLQSNQHTEERGGLPVLEVKEDGDTFRIVLLLCYPYAPPEIKSVEQLVAVGKALDKYCMDHAWKRFVQISIASPLIKEQALRIFAHAVANGWKELGEVAAKNTLNVPLDASEIELEDLRCIDALQYVRLREYHRKCGRAARDTVSMTSKNIRMLWLKEKRFELLFLHPSAGSGIHVPCRWCGGYIGGRPCVLGEVLDQNIFYMHDNWLYDYLSAVMAEALRRPCPEVILGENITQAITKSISQCNHVEWAKIASSQIHLFATLVAEEMDRLISQVPLNIDWAK